MRELDRKQAGVEDDMPEKLRYDTEQTQLANSQCGIEEHFFTMKSFRIF
jgi:hypothetical protein